MYIPSGMSIHAVYHKKLVSNVGTTVRRYDNESNAVRAM